MKGNCINQNEQGLQFSSFWPKILPRQLSLQWKSSHIDVAVQVNMGTS